MHRYGIMNMVVCFIVPIAGRVGFHSLEPLTRRFYPSLLRSMHSVLHCAVGHEGEEE